jgi:type II secretory pathway pseudopilin PulG
VSTARPLRSRCGPDDAGTTLIELVVGMVIMSIFMVIFTGAILTMTQTVNKVQTLTTSTTQINQAFLRLDKLVRYAAAITTPGQSAGGDWYVEIDSSNTGTETCTQLRVDSQQLQLRSWPATSVAPAAFVGAPIADNIANASTDPPFTVPGASVGASTSPFQRLQVTLRATAPSTATSTNRSQMTFTALNSSAAATSNSSICQNPGNRP